MSGTDSTGICAYLAAPHLSQPRGITACAYRRGVTFSSPDLGTLNLDFDLEAGADLREAHLDRLLQTTDK